MEQIRINKGITIGVNDKGDTICIPVEDLDFRDKYVDMINSIQRISDEIDASKEVSEEEADKIEREAIQGVCEAIDECLGTNTCAKVFEGIPTIYAILDFFEQLSPIVEKYTKAKTDRIKKQYSPRTGGKK